MLQVNVSLAERSYGIQIGRGILPKLGHEARQLGLGRRCAIITDKNVAPLYATATACSLKKSGFDPVVIVLPAGEKTKSLGQVTRCYQELCRHRLERNSCIIALGGGVIGDLAGFVAATYLRGIPFIQLPTTFLAQVDSSVGGKVGVNLPEGKNLVGAFFQPRLVLCELNTLKTLPEREFRAGLAEVIKYGIIYDRPLFETLEDQLPALLRRSFDALEKVIARSCEIKAEIVSKDEKETGLRAILNFGHTLGHALEALLGYGKLLHGEAISIGQVWAAELSHRLCGLPEEDVLRIRTLFERAQLPTQIKLSTARQGKILKTMALDKKVAGGEIRFVLIPKIGEARFGQRVPLELLKQLLPSTSGAPKPTYRKHGRG